MGRVVDAGCMTIGPEKQMVVDASTGAHWQHLLVGGSRWWPLLRGGWEIGDDEAKMACDNLGIGRILGLMSD